MAAACSVPTEPPLPLALSAEPRFRDGAFLAAPLEAAPFLSAPDFSDTLVTSALAASAALLPFVVSGAFFADVFFADVLAVVDVAGAFESFAAPFDAVFDDAFDLAAVAAFTAVFGSSAAAADVRLRALVCVATQLLLPPATSAEGSNSSSRLLRCVRSWFICV